jgi:hypothetical protein
VVTDVPEEIVKYMDFDLVLFVNYMSGGKELVFHIFRKAKF